jgi:hypothetical protein
LYLRDNVDVSESEQASNQGRRKRGIPKAFQILRGDYLISSLVVALDILIGQSAADSSTIFL